MDTGLSRRKGPRPPSRARRRGTASVEAVVALPVLLLLFVSVFYVRDDAIALQTAANEARTCAWLYSANNCESLPAECHGSARNVGNSGDPPVQLPRVGGRIGDVVTGLLEGALQAAFGRALDVRTEKSFAPPKVYGGGTKVVHRDYHLACNLGEVTAESIVKDAWNLVYPP